MAQSSAAAAGGSHFCRGSRTKKTKSILRRREVGRPVPAVSFIRRTDFSSSSSTFYYHSSRSSRTPALIKIQSARSGGGAGRGGVVADDDDDDVDSDGPHLILSSSSSSSSSSPDANTDTNTNTDTNNSVVYLGALFALWYIFNIYCNIFNKQVLEVYPFPLTVTAFQFAVGTLFVLLMWTMNLCKRPKIVSSQLIAIFPLAIVHTFGNLFTNMSLGKVAVSFTHTIKAMEPFFTVILSTLFLGEAPTAWVLFSLVPIVGGVALASLTEASFNWAGLWSAMASNLTYQSRNVLSKKIMVNKEESLDNVTLFSIITIMSFFLSLPIALFVEGVNFSPSYIRSAALSVREIYTRSFLAALCFHAYQQVAYMILARVSPVSHSVGNCVKRVVVILSSVLFFRTPVSPVNSLGTGVALAGVFLYSRVNNAKAKAS
ncbi:uncharacterized protein A4U43_C04F460 [Asparagus officinalis]|uniref:Sugar phosphate transporter domain-containing protein n=1 Tax=Asparagus officinalis TaxID=4686 RepID=A0A5P1EX63_ASPOF|nr:phosphoenolpyruvate/phosphate translocator 1, chloroplastic-like [Asparagus officinalis]ONK70685.1 uncharacterized protein A4U43_C04F460 [Asparagus officinalis]